MMAVATWMVASTMTGPRMFGSTWRIMMRRGATPVTRAASTYSLLRSTSVEPRTVRAYWTQPVSEMAMINTPSARYSLPFGNSARLTPAMSSAIRMAGKDSITSHTRMMKASTMPPRKPARSPSPTPTTTDSTTDANPTSSEIRAPNMRADRMSRPWSSVPSRYLLLPPADQAGGRNPSDSSSVARSKGLWGATRLANTAQNTQMKAIAAATTATGEVRKL